MYFLTEIGINDFGGNAVPVIGRFKLVSRCLDKLQRSSAEVLQAVMALENNDQRQAIKGLAHFAKSQKGMKQYGDIGMATFESCFITRQIKWFYWPTPCRSGMTNCLKKTKRLPAKLWLIS